MKAFKFNNSLKINKKLIVSVILIMIPIIILGVIIAGRKIITPSNEEIIEKLRNTKMYTCDVEYEFKNSRDTFNEKTKQYYRYDKGSRIEFNDYYRRVKVYNGTEIKVEEKDGEYSLDKNLDSVYPLAFLENILSNEIESPIKEIEEEWGDENFLEVDIAYNKNNRYLQKAKFYVDKKNKVPVLLKIFDKNDNERIIIKYKNFKSEKIINEGLF